MRRSRFPSGRAGDITNSLCCIASFSVCFLSLENHATQIYYVKLETYKEEVLPPQVSLNLMHLCGLNITLHFRNNMYGPRLCKSLLSLCF